MYGKKISYSSTVKYLGLTLNAKLKWEEHINNTIKTNKSCMRMLASKTNSIHGPKPKLIKWAYTGIVRPRV